MPETISKAGKAFKEVGTEPTKSQKYKKMVLRTIIGSLY